MPQGVKKPDSAPVPEMAEGPATPASAAGQRFIVVSQPQLLVNQGSPVGLPSASNGAVSTYLLLRNQPAHGSDGWPGQVGLLRRDGPTPCGQPRTE